MLDVLSFPAVLVAGLGGGIGVYAAAAALGFRHGIDWDHIAGPGVPGGRGSGATSVGVIVLGTFVVGLLASNTLITLGSAFGFLQASKNFRTYVTVAHPDRSVQPRHRDDLP